MVKKKYEHFVCLFIFYKYSNTETPVCQGNYDLKNLKFATFFPSKKRKALRFELKNRKSINFGFVL